MNLNTKVTQAMIDGWIKNVTYTRLSSGTAIVCEITLYNNHHVHGIANVVDLENYDEELGIAASYRKAVDALCDKIAFSLHENMWTQVIPNKHAELLAEYDKPSHMLITKSKGEING